MYELWNSIRKGGCIYIALAKVTLLWSTDNQGWPEQIIKVKTNFWVHLFCTLPWITWSPILFVVIDDNLQKGWVALYQSYVFIIIRSSLVTKFLTTVMMHGITKQLLQLVVCQRLHPLNSLIKIWLIYANTAVTNGCTIRDYQ